MKSNETKRFFFRENQLNDTRNRMKEGKIAKKIYNLLDIYVNLDK